MLENFGAEDSIKARIWLGDLGYIANNICLSIQPCPDVSTHAITTTIVRLMILRDIVQVPTVFPITLLAGTSIK
jgi:hypothetical protein